MTPGTGRALAVLDAGFVLEMLDRFFGGPGVAPGAIPNEFSATAEMMAARVVRQLAAPLTLAWEPLVRLGFEADNVQVHPAMLADPDADDAIVVTRFGIAARHGPHSRPASLAHVPHLTHPTPTPLPPCPTQNI